MNNFRWYHVNGDGTADVFKDSPEIAARVDREPPDAGKKMTDESDKRAATEAEIMRRVIADALAAGYGLAVHDGGAVALTEGHDPAAIFAALRTTDSDMLQFYKNGKADGWVYFVYGNDGHDVIADYTVNLEPVLAGAEALADTLADEGDSE